LSERQHQAAAAAGKELIIRRTSDHIRNGTDLNWRITAAHDDEGLGQTVSRLCAATVGTQNIGSGHEEATPDQRRGAFVALEAVVVPVTLFERNELRRTQAFMITRTQTYSKLTNNVELQ